MMAAMLAFCAVAESSPNTTKTIPPQTTEKQRSFQRSLGGIGREGGRSVQQAEDGGYIVAGVGSGGEEGEWNTWLVKLSPEGSVDWTRTYSNQQGGYQVGESVQQTRDGGYILAGCINSGSPKAYDVQLIRVNHNGRELWNRTYGGNGWDWGYCARQSIDDGYIVTGWTDSRGSGGSDLWLVKTDAQGNELWNRTYGGVENDLGNFVLPTDDGGYIITGATASYSVGNDDLWVIRTDAYGDVHWMRTFGSTGFEEGSCVERTSDGGFVIVGATTSIGAGNHDIWLLKLDARGGMEWNRTFGGEEWDWGDAVRETPDGGLIIIGTTLSQGAGAADIWLIKTDLEGNQEWSRTYGGSDIDFGHSVSLTSDGGYILTGQTYSFGSGDADMWIIKTDANGLVSY